VIGQASPAVEERVSLARSGAAQLRAVYGEHFAFVVRTLLRLGAQSADADDLAHDVFLVVARRLADYDRSRPMRPWLFGMALRVMSEHRRTIRTRREVALVAEGPADGRGADDRMAEAEARELVIQVLLRLDLDQRAVLVMHDLEGFSMPEVAAALSIPLNTGYSRLRAARERFAQGARAARGAEPGKEEP